MPPSLVLVPRWGGSADHDFYPWLRHELVDEVASIETVVLANPPSIGESVAVLAPLLERAASDTIIVAHSVGVQAVLRALATVQRETPLAALVAVAGWFTVDRPWTTIAPWVDPPLHVDRAGCDRARAAVRGLDVLVSNDDPFTADFVTTRDLFETVLGARVEIVHGGRHFNDVKEPAVLRAVRTWIAACNDLPV